MSITDPQPYRPSIGDRVGIVCFMVIGVAIVVWGAVATALQFADLSGGGGVTATANLVGTDAELPIPGGGSLSVQVDSVLVTAADPSSLTTGTAITAAITRFLVVTVIVVSLMLLARNNLRGRIFSRGNTVLITVAGMTAIVGFGLVAVLDRMVGNSIIAQLTGGAFDDFAVVAADPLPFVLVAFAFGIVATAYTIGARLQRDQEGLV